LDAGYPESARILIAAALAAALLGSAPLLSAAPRPGGFGDVPYHMVGGEHAAEVPAGFDVRLDLVDGARVSGVYVSAGRLPRPSYAAAYATWRERHATMPALGDTVTLVLRREETRRVGFDGFGYHTIEYVDLVSGDRDALARDSVATLAGVPMDDPSLGRLPVWTAMRIAAGRDTTLVGLAEIDSIWGPRALHPTAGDQAAQAVVATGVTVGTILITVALVAGFVALLATAVSAPFGGH
jgi:hypothetical protein